MVVLRKLIVFLVVSSAFIVVYLGSLSNYFINFLDKSNTGSITESVLLSRGSLIDKQVLNISNNPIFGIGFKNPSDLKKIDDIFSTGKAYEKGNMFLASLEELGIIGSVILFLTIIALLKLHQNSYNNLLVLPLIALITIMGEATLFSIGGIGILIWSFVFLSFHNGLLVEKMGKI